MSVIPKENQNIGKADAEKAMRKLLKGAENPQKGKDIRANIRHRNKQKKEKEQSKKNK